MDELEEYKKYLLSSGTDPKEVEEYGNYLKSQGSAPAQTQDEGSAAEAGLQGFGQGVTLGYLPEMQAATEKGLNFILPESMGGSKGFNTGETSYDDTLKRLRGRDTQLKEESPIASAVGNVGGAVMSAPIGGAALKGASAIVKGGRAAMAGAAATKAGVLANTARAAGSGAAYGALANTESESGMLSQDDLMKRLENAGYGALAGGVAEGALAGGGALLRKTGEQLKESSLLKQIGANAGQMKKILGKNELPKIDKFVEEQGLMGLGKSVDDVVETSQKVLDTDGPAIGQLYKTVQAEADVISKNIGKSQGTQINGPELADEILAKAREKYRTSANRDVVMKEIESSVAPLRDMGDNANIVDIHNYRKSLDENINWSQRAKERDSVQNAYVDARNLVSDRTKSTIDAIDKTVGGEQGAMLKKLNERYSAASTVNNVASQGAARDKARVLFGAGVLGGGAGITTAAETYRQTGDFGKAAAVGLGTGLSVASARKYGLPVANKIGRAQVGISKPLEAIGRNPGAVGAGAISPWLLMREREQDGNR